MYKNSHFIAIFVIVSLILTGCHSSTTPGLPNAELDKLDKALSRSRDYDEIKRLQLDSLLKIRESIAPADTKSLLQVNNELGDAYHAFCSDSSVYYYLRASKEAKKAALDSLYILYTIRVAGAQGASGIFAKSQETLNQLDTALFTQSQKIEFAFAARQLYSYMESYTQGHEEMAREIASQKHHYEDYLIDNLPEKDSFRLFLYAERLHSQGRITEANKLGEKLLSQLSEKENLYGMTAYLLAEISRSKGDEYNYAKFLTMAATADVKGSVKETMALPALAKWLYNKGEVDRAYHYINTSLEDAVASNARMRTVEIASLLPLVDDAYRSKLSSSRDELMVYFIISAFLCVVSIGLLMALFKIMRRNSRKNKMLALQSKRQEGYIGHFLGLCSSYSDKLESMRRTVDRKIASGQTEELLKLLKSGKYTDSENDDFFAIFDETFLDLYPGFIEELNLLLKPECQLTHKPGTPLSTELRIYAFLRLGVEESVRIAKILHCSVSTIYTYRNRMRGRAINRETFESDVLKIGSAEV